MEKVDVLLHVIDIKRKSLKRILIYKMDFYLLRKKRMRYIVCLFLVKGGI